jgi:hypothetical protein
MPMGLWSLPNYMMQNILFPVRRYSDGQEIPCCTVQRFITVIIKSHPLNLVLSQFQVVHVLTNSPSFFYSCCCLLEHRASMIHFVLLQFLSLRQSVELLGQGICPSQGHYLTQTHRQTSMP